MTQGIIFGISGLELTSEEISLIGERKPHGIILFKRNCDNNAQILALNTHIKTLSPETKIFIDQEGGRVQRIKNTLYPSMEKLSENYEQDSAGTVKAVEENFFRLMSELKSLGIDVTCAPVCDLTIPSASQVIGDRSFGGSLEKVVALCRAALDGIHRAGGEGVLKHIPGHGRATLDSHHALPIVENSLEELEKTDFAVFKALAKDCKYAMTAHVIYKCLDPNMAATLSKPVIDYIKRKIGFDGIIMTDALEMEALAGVNIKERAKLAYKAGCHIALYCTGKMDGIEDTYAALCEMMNLS
ncbi:MAG UNVERIFIED_CONTAM: beta-N-acetylhexosaminidase [Planctomycetaceae bacterium]|jgi:beta-glucosidase-like glycosyl hydrolase